MPSTLIAHSPKFQSRLVTLEELGALPEPQALGVRHKPVPHVTLVKELRREAEERGFEIKREQLALSQAGRALFGVMDLEDKDGKLDSLAKEQRGLSLGFRSSIDSTMAIKVVAGVRVFVCDNLALSGSLIAIQRKSTTGLQLKGAISGGFDKFVQQEGELEAQISRLEGTGISDVQAKGLIFDVFDRGIVGIRLFEDVGRFYFRPTDEQVDCHPRTLWGLHNAFTRAMRDLPPVPLWKASVRLGKAFELTAEVVEDSADAVDGVVDDSVEAYADESLDAQVGYGFGV